MGEMLAIGASSMVRNGNEVSCDERVARWFATLFCHKFPYTDNTAFKLFDQGWTRIMDSEPERMQVVNKNKRIMNAVQHTLILGHLRRGK